MDTSHDHACHIVTQPQGNLSCAAWYEKILARPAVQKGLDVPEENKFKQSGGSEISQEEIQKKVDEARKFMGSTAKR